MAKTLTAKEIAKIAKLKTSYVEDLIDQKLLLPEVVATDTMILEGNQSEEYRAWQANGKMGGFELKRKLRPAAETFKLWWDESPTGRWFLTHSKTVLRVINEKRGMPHDHISPEDSAKGICRHVEAVHEEQPDGKK